MLSLRHRTVLVCRTAHEATEGFPYSSRGSTSQSTLLDFGLYSDGEVRMSGTTEKRYVYLHIKGID